MPDDIVWRITVYHGYQLDTNLKEAQHHYKTLRCVSTKMQSLCDEFFPHGFCARCDALILPHAPYYVLGGGTVINCAECACRGTFEVYVGGKPVILQRDWDKTQCAKSLQKRMLTSDTRGRSLQMIH
jgi:hypothetical protein